MKTKTRAAKDRKARAASSARAAEQLAKEARDARSKWNKPARAGKRARFDEAGDDIDALDWVGDF